MLFCSVSERIDQTKRLTQAVPASDVKYVGYDLAKSMAQKDARDYTTLVTVYIIAL
jgi:hypothetical protein